MTTARRRRQPTSAWHGFLVEPQTPSAGRADIVCVSRAQTHTHNTTAHNRRNHSQLPVLISSSVRTAICAGAASADATTKKISPHTTRARDRAQTASSNKQRRGRQQRARHSRSSGPRGAPWRRWPPNDPEYDLCSRRQSASQTSTIQRPVAAAGRLRDDGDNERQHKSTTTNDINKFNFYRRETQSSRALRLL